MKPERNQWLSSDRNSNYIKDKGYKLVEMYECEWLRLTRTKLHVYEFLCNKLQRPLDRYVTLNEKIILSAITNALLFGVVECDICVLETLKQKFLEMLPIFKNTETFREGIGAYMKAFAEEHNAMARPCRSLIRSYLEEKILATLLIKWYLEHRLKVTKIYQIIQHTPVPFFKPFGDAVLDASRDGDCNVNKAIIADTIKLVRKLKVSFEYHLGEINFFSLFF